MKKLFAFITALLVLSCFVFAEVTVKDVGGGNAEVTFFYGNPRASEVVIAGTWTDWQNAAEPMTLIEGKGWEYTVTVPVATEMRYKFISDGNWTADLKAPDFVDDGFGGKNGFVDVAYLVAASAASADGAPVAAGGRIKFICWSMFGVQAQYRTSAIADPSKTGIDLDNATVGAKTYAKFDGNFLGRNPFFIEIALFETELDPEQSDGKLYLYKKDASGNDEVAWGDGVKTFFNDVFSNPLAYLAKTTDNTASSAGPGSNPFLGHLKFGFNTRFVNYLTGFNYAKPEINNTILWTTIDGNWDAGYQHAGGFSVFSLGDGIREIGPAKINFTFAPNKSADRKGTKYGLWTFANVDINGFVAEVQYNTFFTGETLFDKPFEHDIIIGTKGSVAGFTYGVQALINIYQNLDQIPNGSAGQTGIWATDMMDYSGYSRSAVYMTDKFDVTKHMAAEARVGYTLPNKFGELTLGYRFRGLESNMLFVADHHNDFGKDTQTAQLGTLNSQRIYLDAVVNVIDGLTIKLSPYFEMPFTTKDWDDYFSIYDNAANNSRWDFGAKESKRIVAQLGVDYNLSNLIGLTSSVSVYGKIKYVTDDADKYIGYDSNFLFSNAGLKFTISNISDIFKGIDFYYGLDNTDDFQMFNTFIASVRLPMDFNVDVAFALRSATPEMNYDVYHPFGFAIGAAKKFSKLAKPTVYVQFVYDMDPYANFGDGQNNLNLDGYCIGNKVRYRGDDLEQNAVNIYEGWAAFRVGIRWDI
ncbi:glycogen-binding domain-containing protein [Brucepastera parasyntrophica]|uniref:glycogen-binding domain-containing protein n=1 Tax=Brucepastera parasyntrophica TaxID=2880008 RepID=UPI0021098851|nr:glycogen-binding domain-containing protein [Brucepastera parasyntrophica]ULQ60875.1 glycogen-binding domain-containing protein [Brucepastera parasyntrophica]